MNGKKNEKRTIVALVAVLLFMAVGFAAFSTTLFIGGSSADGSTVTVKGANWSVHYVSDPTSLNESSTIKATTKTLTNTDYSFTVQLNKVGDVYDASWTVKNDGTIDAVLKQINMSTLTTAQQEYLTYTITYDGTTYSASNTSLNLPLAVNGEKTIAIHLEYKEPQTGGNADPSKLPSTDTPITVSGNFVYESAE